MSEVPDILKLYYDEHHPGINATLTNIRKEYYWIGMCDEVRLYVRIVILNWLIIPFKFISLNQFLYLSAVYFVV